LPDRRFRAVDRWRGDVVRVRDYPDSYRLHADGLQTLVAQVLHVANYPHYRAASHVSTLNRVARKARRELRSTSAWLLGLSVLCV
jgi:hypothetical protein